MTTPAFSQRDSDGPFLDETLYFPEDDTQFRNKVQDNNRDIAVAVNLREIGENLFNEITTGAQLSSLVTPQENLPMFRIVVNFGALPNAGTKAVPHNLPVTDTWQFVKRDAMGNNPTAVDPAPFAIAIPDMNSTLTVTTTNVVITTAVDYSAFTTCYVILDYVKSS